MVQAGLRALGRLRQPEGFDFLVELLDNTDWARYAARALGGFGDPWYEALFRSIFDVTWLKFVKHRLMI